MARFITGALLGAILATAMVALAQEITVTLKNGTLEGRTVVRDNETLLCADPTSFMRARQIQCP